MGSKRDDGKNASQSRPALFAKLALFAKPAFLKCQGGIAAVEFALVLPFLMILIFGIFEVGRALYIHASLQWAAEDGARVGMSDPAASNASLSLVVTERLPDFIAGDALVEISNETVDDVPFVTIETSYSFETLFPIVPIDPITLTGHSRTPRLQ